MAKRRGRRAGSGSGPGGQQQTEGAFQWVPLWGWALLFLLPLIASELMFWNVGKIPSMVIFPVAWVGFWYVTMERAGWPILKGRDDRSSTDEDQ